MVANMQIKNVQIKNFSHIPEFLYIYIFFFAGELLNNSSKNYYKVLVA